MPSTIRGNGEESLEDAVTAVAKVLNDEDVKHYGLEAEVLGTALLFLKENPDANIATALSAGYTEWDL
jgi:hypothetical protein